MRRRRVWLSDIAQSPQTTYYNYDTMRCLPAPFKFIARADHFEVPNRFYMLQEDLYVGALLGMGKSTILSRSPTVGATEWRASRLAQVAYD